MVKVFSITHLQKVILHVIGYFILFCLPILYSRLQLHGALQSSDQLFLTGALEFFMSLLLLIVLFWAVLINRIVARILMPVFYFFGAVSDYFLFNFSRHIDVGAIQETLGNELDLVKEFIPATLVLSIVVAFIIYYILNRYRLGKAPAVVTLLFVLTFSSAALVYDHVVNHLFMLRSVVQSYMPTNAFYSIGYYFIHYYWAEKEAVARKDISELYSFNILENKSNEPLIVVMVVGESLRGDMVEPNGYSVKNMPKLAMTPNLISFTKARTYTNLTRESVPLMLTRAAQENFAESLTETSIISVFKKLGFSTAWIGNQGLFAGVKPTFGPIAMESDYIVNRSDLRRLSGNQITYDGYMLPFFDEFLANNSGNNIFVVFHMMGSHWEFDERYPKDFMQYQPTCQSAPGLCSKAELFNGYNNTVIYTDYFLKEIINRLDKHRAIMLYASDHGFSLMEGGFFSNATPSKPKEQMNIAMFAWASDKYLKDHPQQFAYLQKKYDQDVSHDHIFHSLLGCSNIKSDIIEGKLNLCE